MRTLSTTTALLTSLALAVPVTFPATMPAHAQSEAGDASACIEGSTDPDCIEADDTPERRERRGARQESREGREQQRPEGRREAQRDGGEASDLVEEILEEARPLPFVEPAETAPPEDAAPRERAADPAPRAGQDTGSEGGVTSAEDLAERLRGAFGQPEAEAPDEAPAEARSDERREDRQQAREDRQQARPEAQEDEVREAPRAEAEPAAPLTAEQIRQELEAEERQAETRRERRRLRAEAEASGAFVEDPADQAAAGDGVSQGPSDAVLEAATGAFTGTLAGSGEGAVVEEETRTVTERNARRSSDGFVEAETRRDRSERREEPRAGGDDNNDVRNLLTGVIVGAAGAMIVGSLLRDNREVVSTAPDRVVVRDQYGNLQVLRDDDATLRQPGSEVTTRRYADGSSETIVMQDDGTQVVTVRNAEARVVRRVHIGRDGLRTVLFDDTVQYEPVVVSQLPPPNRTQIPRVDYRDQQALRQALMTESSINRSFSLNQIRQIDRVRYLAPAIQVENITFPSGSAAVSASEAQGLLALGQLMASMIRDNPNEVFLIEGHTDAVGSAVMNLTLSDRRAESVARALTEYFGVPAANMVLQGYGETDLRVPTEAAERANRRVVVRRLTPLLQVAQSN